MTNKERYQGIIPPIVTPLTSDEKIDEAALKKLIDFCLGHGCSGVFVNGSCGEAMRITDDLWERAMKVTLDHVGDRAIVFCGAIDSSTTRQLEKIKKIRQAGGEIAVCTVPFYHHIFSNDEIVAHYHRLCEDGGMKIAVYNIPDTTHENIAPCVFNELGKLKSIAVVKDSSADIQQIQREITLLKDCDVSVFNGAEELIGPCSLLGIDGNIPGLANFMPALIVKLYQAAKAGNIEETIALQRLVTRARDTLFVGGSWIASMKYMLEYYGLGQNILSFPLKTLTDEQKVRVRAILNEVGR